MTTQTSQVPVKASPKSDLKALLQSDKVRNEIAAVAPKYMDPERMLRVALMVCIGNPKLLQCSQTSLLSALLKCSAVGLEPDGFHAYLIPFGDQVQVIFGYQGLIFIAEQFGVTSVDAESICENDSFTWKRVGSSIQICHEIDWKKPRGNVVSYYAVCEREGKTQLAVMTMAEIEEVRATSKAKNSGPWVTAYGEMCKKTVIRRLAKRWPRMGEVQKAFNADDDTEAGKFTPKAPEFSSRPIKSPSMEFLNSPAGSLTDAPAVPMGEDDEEKLAEQGLAPVTKIGSQEHTDFEAWMHANGILYSQLAEIPDLGIDEYPSLRDIPAARIRTLGLAKADILAAAKGAKA